ncbi:hypothetical protein H0H81_007958 [Sphagnurus paluster]|uniref:Uncharacterized protein n=1 Tax=Sphagnurus paluster TaxID=117069 RepID=A0A9P7GNA2_9AGAR|nr:hypothetical protein H0H81_007958 [Sphagnurus paluster]
MESRVMAEDTPATSDISLESDIVDCASDLQFSFDEDIPSRPTSRLGFNRFDDSISSDEDDFDHIPLESLSEEGDWTHQSPEDFDMDITTLISERDSGSPASSVPCVNFSGTIDSSFSDEEGADLDADPNFDCSSCEDSDDESDTTSLFPATEDASKVLAASFSPSPPEDFDWSIRPKYSCLPSPLSPWYIPPGAYTFKHTAQRHRYQHHGHSRHAFHHVKWFWATREDRWLDHQARLCEAKAYDGLSIFKTVSPTRRLSEGYVPTGDVDVPRSPPSPPIPNLPPLSIHPRRGDLSALRDPYAMHIDRYFVGMPMWTMAKTLWMFDVHMGSSSGVQAAPTITEDLLEEEQSESDPIETSASNAFSDDSDSTLVDSENEEDAAKCIYEAKGSIDVDQHKVFGEDCKDDVSSSIFSSSSGKISPSFLSPTSSSSKTCESSRPRSPWPANWYRRWEVLLQLCIDNNPAIETDSDIPQVTTPAKSQRFFIADD